jgi:hypothetical protein
VGNGSQQQRQACPTFGQKSTTKNPTGLTPIGQVRIYFLFVDMYGYIDGRNHPVVALGFF